MNEKVIHYSGKKHILRDLGWLEKIASNGRTSAGRSYLILKHTLDYLFIFSTLPIWLPLFVLIALLLKMEYPCAPVFYIQYRTGKGGRRFPMFKFRTMVPNADELKSSLEDLNILSWPDFKIRNDPRISPVGWYVRKFSLDEAPQIINVLKGEMSLVGPRPTSFEASTYALWQTERLDVYPGITGLWQIIGRGSTEFCTRARLDIAYIERCCIWLDIQILFRTFASIFQQRGIL